MGSALQRKQNMEYAIEYSMAYSTVFQKKKKQQQNGFSTSA